MNKVLITGGTGFVGKWLKETQPAHLLCHYLNRKNYHHSMWEWGNWDMIIHAAPISPKRTLKYCDVNNSVFLYISSGIIYHPEWDTEYRKNKIWGENLCIHSSAHFFIARLFTFYGEELDENKAYTQFERAAKEHKPIHIWGDGKAVRSYMHGEKMGRWLWQILLNGKKGEAYDVGSDEPITLLQLAIDLNQAYKSEARIYVENRLPDPMPVYLPPNTIKTKALFDK